MNYKVINSTITKALSVTHFGDYLSSIGYGIILSETHNNILYTGLIWPIRSISQALGAYITPFLISKTNTRIVLVNSQYFLSILSLIMFSVITIMNNRNYLTVSIITIWIILSTLSQVFLTAKEGYSKEIDKLILPNISSEVKTSRALQIKNEFGQFFGQAVGPLAFIFLVYYLKMPIKLTIIIDAISFAIAWNLLRKIPNLTTEKPSSILKSVKLLLKNKTLMSIFIIRGFLFWISMGILNFTLTPIAVKNHHIDLRLSPLIYVAIGVGGLLFTQLFESRKINFLHDFLHKKSNSTLAIFGTLTYSLAVIIYSSTFSIFYSAIALILMGFGNGFQRISTRDIIRENCSDADFSTFSAICFFAGRITDFIFTLGVAKILFSGKSLPFIGIFSGIFILSTIPFFIFISFKEKGTLSK